MARIDPIETLNTWADRREARNRKNHKGEVHSVSVGLAMVKVGGSSKLLPVEVPFGMEVAPTDKVLLVLNHHRGTKWVVSDILEKGDPTQQLGIEQSSYAELFSPQSIEACPSPIGTAAIQWRSPISLPVTCEVQTSPDDATWTTTHFTRGAYAVVNSEEIVYFRVRCIADNGQVSEWSQSVQVEPTESIDLSDVKSIIDSTSTIPEGHHAYLVGPIEITGDLTVEGELIIL